MLSSAIATRSALRGAVTTGSRARVMSSGRSYSTMHDNDPATLEREKHRNLTGEQLKTPHIKSAPGWNENLASSSEAYIKADKHPHDETIEDLQRETVEYVHTRHSPEERISGRESAEKLDEVIGPLGGKVLQKRTVKETKEEVVEEDNQAIRPRR
ncbi:hypothetical protein FIBSPDRAFT_1043329 [Athelia psychrophila]|uniref:Uncharacterized protein n=1 Tax=Athelia psychrophila TaxID=1759441 RepID=A0A166LA01_9AGAM|nr:hypothetical protein FIBSPDRAFT_1043329 [Fibularhizoctonia sp. CBS 109695]